VRSERIVESGIWEIQTKRLIEVSRFLQQISEQWDAALGRLRSLVKRIGLTLASDDGAHWHCGLLELVLSGRTRA